ncbi:hypothetical protein K3727_22840 (plasmid) [Rhodobacteraceae bacterium M382]|nr:hypothetical protein K3727_22840 [Rhodobacteraceae bacterium M382]
MATETHGAGPGWWTAPGETDTFAFVALAFVFLIVFLVIHLYARFDQHAEHKSEMTPLKTTIPTLLTVALAYEVLPPLSHFSVLLPLALISAALARDLMVWLKPEHEHAHEHQHEEVSE